jgi:hypothetical protein
MGEVIPAVLKTCLALLRLTLDSSVHIRKGEVNPNFWNP